MRSITIFVGVSLAILGLCANADTERVNDFETEVRLNSRSFPAAAERRRGHGQVFDLTTAPWKTHGVFHTSPQQKDIIMLRFLFLGG
jgi:hypothetical protein